MFYVRFFLSTFDIRRSPKLRVRIEIQIEFDFDNDNDFRFADFDLYVIEKGTA